MKPSKTTGQRERPNSSMQRTGRDAECSGTGVLWPAAD
jgi:hypothetical protein